jgi:hypothetical protein
MAGHLKGWVQYTRLYSESSCVGNCLTIVVVIPLLEYLIVDEQVGLICTRVCNGWGKCDETILDLKAKGTLVALCYSEVLQVHAKHQLELTLQMRTEPSANHRSIYHPIMTPCHFWWSFLIWAIVIYRFLLRRKLFTSLHLSIPSSIFSTIASE